MTFTRPDLFLIVRGIGLAIKVTNCQNVINIKLIIKTNMHNYHPRHVAKVNINCNTGCAQYGSF